MNNDRRKQIAAIKERFEQLAGLASGIKDDLESIRDDEQEYFDNMPEGLQSGEKGEKSEAAVCSLEEAIDALDSLLDGDIEGNLDSAAE